MSKMLHIFAGLILMGIVPVWIVYVTPYLLRVREGYSSTATMIHTENNRFEQGSDWSGLSLTTSSSEISVFKPQGLSVPIQTRFVVQSLLGEVLFELKQSFLIDPQTRRNLPGGNDLMGNSQTMFSPLTNKNDKNYWTPEMGAPAIIYYVDTQEYLGLSTLHFRVADAVINDTLGYDFLPQVPEQYQVLSKINMDIYIEPFTGTVIDHQDSGVSYYADKNNTRVWDIAQWSNHYDDKTIRNNVAEAKKNVPLVWIVARIIPALIEIVALMVVITGIFRKRK